MAQQQLVVSHMKLRNNLGLLQDKQYDWFMKTIGSALSFSQSDTARFRLHCISVIEKSGWEAFNSAFPKVGRRSVYRWRKRYLDSGKKLVSLIPCSTRPKNVRQMHVPSNVLGFIKTLRKKYPRLSKYKIKPFLDMYCQENQLPTHSVSWIGKVINRYQFFFNERHPVRRKRRALKAINRIGSCPKQTDIKLGYLQLDGVVIVFRGRKYCFLTAVELKTRQAFAKRVPSLSSKQARIFLEEIINMVAYPIHTIQTDNGSEFEGVFRKALKELAIKQLNSYPKSPKTQGYVERFNWTIQDEFINYEIDRVLVSTTNFDAKLQEWLHYYNHIRPHQSLNYQTPNQYLLQLHDIKQT